MDLVKTEPRIRVSDSLNTISDIITTKLKRWDCFDLDVPKSRLEATKRVIRARDLEWVDPELEVDDVITLVVGVKGADFEEHERMR